MTIELRSQDGARAVISAFGANCIELALPHRDADGPVRLIGPVETSMLRSEPTRHGCPILFPFPGFVRNGRYAWLGRDHQLSDAAGRPHYAHGFAHRRTWTAMSTSSDRLELALDTDEGSEPGYPFALASRATFRLESRGLSITLRVRNIGRDPAPVGLGFHPYFETAPLGVGRDGIVAYIAGRRRYDLPDGFPTESCTGQPVGTGLPGREGTLLLGVSDLTTAQPVTSLRSEQTQRAILVRHGATTTDVVLWAPQDRECVSLEPLTCPLSVGSLLPGASRSLSLEPGDSRSISMEIALQ